MGRPPAATNGRSLVAYGSLRAVIRGKERGRSHEFRRFRCRMIPCAKKWGRSVGCAQSQKPQTQNGVWGIGHKGGLEGLKGGPLPGFPVHGISRVCRPRRKLHSRPAGPRHVQWTEGRTEMTLEETNQAQRDSQEH